MSSTKLRLEALAEMTFDSVEGYRKAADTSNSANLKRILSDQANKRAMTLNRLNTELVRLGGEPVTNGTPSGSFHRLWLDVTDLFTKGDKAAVNRAEEGEDHLADHFKAALESDDIEPATHAVIRAAYDEIHDGERLTTLLADQLN